MSRKLGIRGRIVKKPGLLAELDDRGIDYTKMRPSPTLLCAALIAGLPAAGSMVHSLRLSPADVSMLADVTGLSVSIRGGEASAPPGSPLLPVVPVSLVLPAGASSAVFTAEVTGSIELPGRIDVRPAGVLRPLDIATGPSAAFRDEAVYSSRGPWPDGVISAAHVGRLCGFTIASCAVRPWSYDPVEGRLSLITGLDITVNWTDGEPAPRTSMQVESALRRVETLVDNPGCAAAFAPPVRPDRSGDAEWVVICDSAFAGVFEPLRLFREDCGLSSAILTVQEAMESQAGPDSAARLRSAIDSLVNRCGTVFVLLAGDETLVPVRTIYSECEGFVDYEVPCDHYLSDLDGSWDANGDGEYGQPEDGMDLYSDVLLGRLPFSTEEQASAMVGKTIAYGQEPPGGSWATTALLCGAMLFDDIGYTGGKGCDTLAAELPSSWEIVKIYENPESADGTDTHIAYLNSGTGWNYYAGHGNYRGIYWKWEPMLMMTRSIAEAMTNGPRTGIHTSIACHPGDYTENLPSCAEALLWNPDGGGVSATFNTGVGWEGFWPELGVSEWLCILYTRAVFRDHAPTLGEAFASAKDQRVPLMHGGYDRNLQAILAWTAFHDPALEPLGVPPVTPVPPVPLSLGAPWPNPAGRGAPITFTVFCTPGPTEVSVYDMAGRLMWRTAAFVQGDLQWSGMQTSGKRVPAGVYIIAARRGDFVVSRLVTVLE